jgi:hypothetical protein
MGEGESRQRPPGAGMLTSAFAESTRAPRPAAAAYAGQDDGRLLAVDSERPAQGPEMTKDVGLAVADARMRGEAITPTDAGARVLAVGSDRADPAGRTLADRAITSVSEMPVVLAHWSRSRSPASGRGSPRDCRQALAGPRWFS